MIGPNFPPTDLEAVAAEIKRHVALADERVLLAAKLLVETKAKFDAGEITSTTWRTWSSEALGLGERRIRELLVIGRDANPPAALEQQRASTAARQGRYRAKAAAIGAAKSIREGAASSTDGGSVNSQTDVERIVSWANDASAEDLRAVLAFIARYCNRAAA